MLSWDIALLWMSCQQQAKCLGDFLARHFLAGVFEFKPIFFFPPSVCSCSMSLNRKVKIVLCICKILLSTDPLPYICSTVWEVGVAVNNLQSRPWWSACQIVSLLLQLRRWSLNGSLSPLAQKTKPKFTTLHPHLLCCVAQGGKVVVNLPLCAFQATHTFKIPVSLIKCAH